MCPVCTRRHKHAPLHLPSHKHICPSRAPQLLHYPLPPPIPSPTDPQKPANLDPQFPARQCCSHSFTQTSQAKPSQAKVLAVKSEMGSASALSYMRGRKVAATRVPSSAESGGGSERG
ncbi:hypothetical protein M758_2G006400 [Ceratodon purpureus]|uniref:Uncharacterized protein n=1 Tax=Ceratodon purpureus TaxID=3225 RepID=A0A8T0INL9_CERPU|nr:hypothetical protein KC19_2G006000 [Ceratodon purpureus]KAG0585370.1 hypothetical protein KC19_2G006500 [Ceratodon purpureus]KAG0624814.1 hypothetical protein M758_2G006100 [Ceratodon purpureus]KAG0624818.1 hypothetical protein M758_2G006400 [Ceratodon purpureus]